MSLRFSPGDMVYYTNSKSPGYGEIYILEEVDGNKEALKIQIDGKNHYFNRAGLEIPTEELDNRRDLYSILPANPSTWRYLNKCLSPVPPTQAIYPKLKIGDKVYAPQFYRGAFILTDWEIHGIKIDEQGFPVGGIRPIVFKVDEKNALEWLFCMDLPDIIDLETYLKNFGKLNPVKISHTKYEFLNELDHPRFEIEVDKDTIYVGDKYPPCYGKAFGSPVEALEYVENNIFAMNMNESKALIDKFYYEIKSFIPKAKLLTNPKTHFDGEIRVTEIEVPGYIVRLELGLYGTKKDFYLLNSIGYAIYKTDSFSELKTKLLEILAV